MSASKHCFVCNQPHAGRGHVCKGCKTVLDRLSVLYDGPSMSEKEQRAGRVHSSHRKAAVKNGTVNIHDKEMKATANAEARKQRKDRVTKHALRLGDTRYRDRRTFAATQELIETIKSDDFSVCVSEEDLPTTFVDCDTDFNVNNTTQPATLGQVFVDTDPRFIFFLLKQEESDSEPVETEDAIEQIADMVIVAQRHVPAGFHTGY